MYESIKPEGEGMRFRETLKQEIAKSGLSAERFERVLGVFLGDEEGGVDDGVEQELLERLRVLEEQGMTVDVPGALLSEMQRHEQAPGFYFEYVDSLSISPKEKRVLKSVLEGDRNGELTFIDPKTLDYVVPIGLRIEKGTNELSREDRAERLLGSLKAVIEVIGKKPFGVEFVEE